MAALVLQWLESKGPAIPRWTVPIGPGPVTTHAVPVLAGFSVTMTKDDVPQESQVQTLEVRTLLRQLSTTPSDGSYLTWVAVEAVARFTSGGSLGLELGDFQVALLLINGGDASDGLTVGVATSMGGVASQVPADGLSVSLAAPLLAGFNTTFENAQHKLSEVSISGVTATIEGAQPSQQISVAATALANDQSDHVATGSVDVAFVAYSGASNVLVSVCTVALDDLRKDALQTVSFGSATVASAVVAIQSFRLGFSSEIGDQAVERIAIRVRNLGWSGASVTFNASAEIAAGKAPDIMQVVFAVIATASPSAARAAKER